METYLSKKFTVKDFALKNQKSGTWPSSEHAIRALKAGMDRNGFEDSFIHVGRRVLVDEDKFWEAVSRLQTKKQNIGVK